MNSNLSPAADLGLALGSYLVSTASGSTYLIEVGTTMTTIRRRRGRPSESFELRQDDEAIEVLNWLTPPTIGQSMAVELVPLRPHAPNTISTTRITTAVVAIDRMN